MTILNEIEGNLIDILENDETDVVIHQTNCFQSLGEGVSSGIARALGDQYPEVMSADLQYQKGDINQLGKIIIVPITTKSGLKKFVVNCYSQYYYGSVEGTSPTSYISMQLALLALNEEVEKANFEKVRFSTYQLGCNRGGADWEIVKSILQTKLPSIYKLDIVTFKTK